MRTLRCLLLNGVTAVVLAGACAQADGDQVPAPSTTRPTTTTQAAAPTKPPPDPCAGLELSPPISLEIVPALTEISGAVASHRTPGAIWLHEDSGNDAMLTEMGLDGRLVSRWTVPGIDPQDWEDIAAVVDPAGIRHLFVGDIGDNRQQRPHVEVVRIPEPGDPRSDGATDASAVLSLRYPTGARNAEALLVDPVTADLLVLTKSITGVTELFVGGQSAWLDDGDTIDLELAGTLDLGLGQAVLAADLSPSGERLALRTPSRVLIWANDPARPLSSILLDEQPCRAPAVFDLQGEAIALLDEGYVLLGEAEAPMLVIAQ